MIDLKVGVVCQLIRSEFCNIPDRLISSLGGFADKGFVLRGWGPGPECTKISIKFP